MAELQEAVKALSGSESSGVIVTGAAGSGRTRLLADVAEALSGQFTVIAHSIPESCRRLKFGIGSVLAPGLPAGSKVSPLTLVRACRDSLRSRDPGANGILMVLDNVDHLDGTSLWVVNQLLLEPDIKMLASHRSDRQLQLELMESVVARQLSIVTLEDLTLDQIRVFLEHRLPGRPEHTLVREIHAVSGANALTARWLVEEALAGGRIVERDGHYSMVRPLNAAEARQPELARRRIEALPPEQRQVVDLLAAAEPAPLADLALAVPPDALAALERGDVIRLQIRSDGGADVTLNHEVEASAARNCPGVARPLALQGAADASGVPAGSGEEPLWNLFRRVDTALDSGTVVADLDLLAVATTANNLYDSDRALRAAASVKAPELQLMAQTEAARALFHARKYGQSAEVLQRLLETTPAVLSMEFARAVALLLQTLIPTNPGRQTLQSVLDSARTRLSLAAAASIGDTAADTYQNAVQDELDVLQLYLESRDGNWPSPAGELFHRLCPAGFCEGGHPGPEEVPGTHAGILLLALAAQGLSVRGQSADAVELSARALTAVEHLPRCSVDFHSMVLAIHASNLARLGEGGSAEAGNTVRSAGRNKWMNYPGGPLKLFRAMMFCRHSAAGHGALHASDEATAGDPGDLLSLTLGAQATAEWLAWDLAQLPAPAGTTNSRGADGIDQAPDVDHAPNVGQPADGGLAADVGQAADGGLADRLAERYATVARPAVTGAAGPPQRTPRKPSADGGRGRRSRELLNLGVAARTDSAAFEGSAFEQAANGPPDWRWSSDGNSGPVPGGEQPPRIGTAPAGADYSAPSGKDRAATADPAKLSQREREVAVLVVTGLRSAHVAAELGIAVNTVNAHLQRIYGKLGVSRRQELAELWNSRDGVGP